MQRPDDLCAWCKRPLPPPTDETEAAWGDLWLSFSLRWGPRPQHDFCGDLCPACGKLLLRYAVDPWWRAMIEEGFHIATEHGFVPVDAYRRLVDQAQKEDTP